MPLIITIDKKFTSVNLYPIISRYWEKSLVENEIIFNLKKIEWISLEEITFLFGWIRHIKYNNPNLKKFFVELPPISQKEPEYFTDEQAKEDTIRRRKTRLISLWERWKIYEKCELGKDEFDVTTEINKYINNKDLNDNNWHRIVPFFAIPINKYHNIYELRETIKADVEKKFKIQEHVLQILIENTSNSVFENKSLSNIITTELYLNVIHHSFNPEDKRNKECYFAISFRNKIDIERYILQKKEEGKTFSIEAANKNIQFILEQNANNERPEDERYFFQNNNNKTKYLNESYIEFTFTDFGEGIAATLNKTYEEEINNPLHREFLEAQLSEVHFNSTSEKSQINKDSLILEFAFLLHTSRHPFEKQIEVNEYVPRGLYFVLDIIKRYKGMVVVRSNNGKIVFDFSKVTEIKDAVRFSSTKETSNYPGTLISIFIPAEKNQGVVKLNAVQRILHYKQDNLKRELHYINISDLQKESINIYKFENNFTDPDLNKLYNIIFQSLNRKLDEFSIIPCVLYIDFAGTDASAIDHKIYYYLSNTPKINENTSVVILNGTDKGVLRNVQDSIIKSNDFICRPIPCVFSNEEVIWIGIKNLEDEKTLNELWKYIESRPSFAVSDFKDISSLSGNIVKIDWINKPSNIGNVTLQMLSDEEIKNYKFTIPEPSKKYSCEIVPALFIKSILAKNEKHKVLLQKDNEVYWTSGGYYQKEFIRFIEKLYEINFTTENVTKYQNDFEFGRKVSEYLIRKYEYKLKKTLEFDCIVSVTLSSQLLANTVRDIYCEIKNINNEKEKPTIVRLANYYEFTNEKAFKKIKPKQKVLIVNDVISTGKLNEEIYESLVGKEKLAEVVGIFSLIDSRQKGKIINDKIIPPEVKHFSTPYINDKTIWLLQNPIEKFIINPNPKAEIISIDPVINTPNTMRYERSDITRLVYSDSPTSALNNYEFLKRITDSKTLLVGHFHHNVAHHSYFFKLHEWFLSESGQDLIKFMVDLIKKKETGINNKKINNEKKKTVVDFIQNELIIHESFFKESEPQIFKQYQKALSELKKLKIDSEQLELPIYNNKTDLIFYPMFSGAEIFDKDNFKNVFKISSHSDFILFPLGRVATPKGWRFTFPPKVLNEITEKYKYVFILDDGSCTGDTLMQMIDSVAFLNVERITVLSVLGRLEDFQREFFTRLQSIKVIYEKDDKVVNNRIIPLNIFFGAHFHIHVYPAFTSNCPFCEELQMLESEKNLTPPEPVLRYIEHREEELEVFETDGLRYEHYFESQNKSFEDGLVSYLPRDIDRTQLFLYRDRIGKLSSYRTFKEYLKGFVSNNLEIWIAVLLHEPKLLRTIEQLLPSLKLELLNFVKNVFLVEGESKVVELEFSWKQSQLIRFLYLLEREYLSEAQHLKNLLNFLFIKNKPAKIISDTSDSLDSIVYHIWKQILSKEKNKDELILSQKYIQTIDEVWLGIDVQREKLVKANKRNLVLAFDKLIHWIRFHQPLFNRPQDIFMQLKTFYEIKSTEFPNHNVYLQAFDLLIGQLRRNITFYETNKSEFVNEKEIQRIKDISVNAFSKLNESPLKFISNSKFQRIIQKTSIYENYTNEKDFGKITNYIQKMISDLTISENLKENIFEIKSVTELMMEIYLSGRSNFAKFFKEHESDFGELFSKTHEGFESLLKDNLIDFPISDVETFKGTVINMHPDLFNQIVRQLYNNSIKHTKLFREKFNLYNSKIFVSNSCEVSEDRIILRHCQDVPNENGKGKGYEDIEIIVSFFGGKVIKDEDTEKFRVSIEFLLSNNKIELENGN